MPEIKVIKHVYRDDKSFHSHAREEKLWAGPNMVLWITYDRFPLQLVIRRDGNGIWEAANVFHDDYVLVCPLCKQQGAGSCAKAAAYMDKLAEDALNHPSFRLIALFEL